MAVASGVQHPKPMFETPLRLFKRQISARNHGAVDRPLPACLVAREFLELAATGVHSVNTEHKVICAIRLARPCEPHRVPVWLVLVQPKTRPWGAADARCAPGSRPCNRSYCDRLNLAEKQEDDNNDEDDSDNSHSAMSKTVAIAPKPPVIAAE
jgi:hypothetical protein